MKREREKVLVQVTSLVLEKTHLALAMVARRSCIDGCCGALQNVVAKCAEGVIFSSRKLPNVAVGAR